jgi:Tol biopolymer transport system component
MGEVYRARDARLGRDLAIKVSGEHFSERLAGEARTIAALNHPNIATLYDVGEYHGSLYLAMEFVKGAPLKGPCEVKEAIGYGIQIAEGLAAAHEAGIVHRDLKPANILVTEKGAIKILDFGLAKLTEQSQSGATAATRTLTISGTPGYLAPEQLQGKPADSRSDIFAFGCILYELLGGRRAFPGETLAAALASTAMLEPSPLPGVPEELEKLIRLCLRKDPERRLQNIGDARIALEDLRDQPSVTGVSVPAGLGPSGRWWNSPAWAVVAAAACLMAGVLAMVHFREKPAEQPVVCVALGPPEKTAFTPFGGVPTPALVSPDGRRIVFSATNSADGKAQLWVRALDALAAQPLPGTEGGVPQFWSPDSRTIAFAAGGKLRKIDAGGGPPLTLADAPGARGGSWSPEGVVVFAPNQTGPLMRVAAAGGATAPATKLDAAHDDVTHRFPWFLPDGRHFLFEAGAASSVREHAAVRIGSLDSLESKVLLEADTNAIYSQGYVLFLRETTLMAQPFDAKRLALAGEAAPVAEQVQHMFTTVSQWYGLFSTSGTGLLAYQAGAGSDNLRLTWMDRSGKRVSTVGDPADLGTMQISPDLKSAAVTVTEDKGKSDIWIYDLARGLRTRSTFDPAAENSPVWSPDGRTIVFSSDRKGRRDLYRKASDGTGADELLYADTLEKSPNSWSPDGKFLLYTATGDPKTGQDVWVLPLAAGAKPFPLVQTSFNELQGQFSPDGKWVAYQSTESGRTEIYVIPFHPEGGAPGGKRQVSAAGGILARWRSDGKELFFVGPDRRLMAAEVGVKGGTFEVGQVTGLFGGLITGQGFLYDVAAGGQRFLAVLPPEQTGNPESLTLVQNWTAALRK